MYVYNNALPVSNNELKGSQTASIAKLIKFKSDIDFGDQRFDSPARPSTKGSINKLESPQRAKATVIWKGTEEELFSPSLSRKLSVFK